jgi:hypothetical protein
MNVILLLASLQPVTQDKIHTGGHTMNDVQLRVLNILKEACASPVVAQSTDEKLKRHLSEIGVLATQLMVDLVTAPELKKQAMQSYAALVPETEKFFSVNRLDITVTKKLTRLGKSDDPAQYENCLSAAREVLLALRNIETAESIALQKKIALVEGAYSKAFMDAFAAQSPERAADAPAVAGQIKDFDQNKLNDFIRKSFPEEKEIHHDHPACGR